MCQDLYRRGPDSAGFALYGTPVEGALVVRVDLDRPDHDDAAAAVVDAAEELTAVKEWSRPAGACACWSPPTATASSPT